jgi:hypothetical protein
VSETGVAAHIYAASPDGPRGTGGLTSQQRRAITNGLWLCHRCGRLVDNNEGDAYPPSLLRSWRDLHDARIRLEHGGYARPFGWISTLEILDHPYFETPQVLHLSRCNLIRGQVGTGKTLLLSLLTALSNPSSVMSRVRPGDTVSATLKWFDPQLRTIRLAATAETLLYQEEDKTTPFVARPYRSIIINNRTVPHDGSVAKIASALGIDPWIVRGILPRIGTRLGGHVSEVRIVDDTLSVRMKNSTEFRTWHRGFSGGEMTAIFFELAITLADLQSDVEPTLLAFDDALDMVDSTSRRHLLDLMSGADRSFQSVVFGGPRITPPSTEWTVTELAWTNGHGRIHMRADEGEPFGTS